jgi:hypothetical protein
LHTHTHTHVHTHMSPILDTVSLWLSVTMTALLDLFLCVLLRIHLDSLKAVMDSHILR